VSIDEVFRATEAGTADYGVVPVENSSEGAINRTLDLMLAPPPSSAAKSRSRSTTA
jgi:chorismate mutase/prephenate dehydratase